MSHPNAGRGSGLRIVEEEFQVPGRLHHRLRASNPGLPTQAGAGQGHGTRGAYLTALSFALTVAGNILG